MNKKKRFMRMIAFFVSMMMVSPLGAFASSSTVSPTSNYDNTNTNKGSVGVRYLSGTDTRVKTRVQAGEERYDYDLFGRNQFENFPLQLGNADYTVTIFENVTDNRYRVVERRTLPVVVKDLLDVYRNSIQTVNWNEDMAAIEKAEELAGHLKTEKAKLLAIYRHVIRHFKYDYDKISGLQSTYVPDVELVYEAGKGICYDYAAVFAAMLRSQGIPTKLMKGYTDNVKEYHAWNEVYLSAEKRWIVIDTTFDSVYLHNGLRTTMEKDAKLYRPSKEY